MAVTSEIVLAGKFLTESLTRYETEIMDEVYAELWGYEGRYHDARADLPFGTLKYTTARMALSGKAANYGGRATTIPLANYGINMDEYKVAVGVVASEWTWQELQSEQAAQLNPYLPRTSVVESYRRAMERALREWMHFRTVFGDPSIGFTGLINSPYVETIVVPYVAGTADLTTIGSPIHPNTPAAAIYEFFRRESSDFRKTSRLTGDLTTALVSEDIRAALQKRFTDGSSDGTPMNLLTNRTQAPSFAAVNTINEFSSAIAHDPDFGGLSGAAYDYALLMDSTSDASIMRHYADIDTTEPFLLDDGLTYRQVGLCATSEVIFSQPYRARLYKFAKA